MLSQFLTCRYDNHHIHNRVSMMILVGNAIYILRRRHLLAESDKEMMIDRMGLEVPTGVSFSAWLEFLKKLGSVMSGDLAKYRQELRDIPQQEGFPYCVVFPTKK